MNVSTLSSPVQSILKDYYKNKGEDNTSSLIFGSNTIEVVIAGSNKSSIDLTQYNEIMESVTIMGVYSMVVAYPQKFRIYLACLFGMQTSDKSIPDHFGPSYASQVLPYTINKTAYDTSTIRFRSGSFTNLTESDVIADISKELEAYGDDATDFDIGSIRFVEVSNANSDEVSNDEVSSANSDEVSNH